MLNWQGGLGGNDRGLELEYSIFEKPAGDPLTLPEIKALMWRPDWEKARVDSAELIAPAPLHAASFGFEPVAAIGPPAGTTSTISFEAPAVRPGDATLQVSTRSRSVSKGAAGPGSREGALIDVLGPTVAIWSKIMPSRSLLTYTHVSPIFEEIGEEKRPLQPYRAERIDHSPWEPPAPGNVLWRVVIVRRGAFAVRIAPGPNVAPQKDRLSHGEEIEVTVPRVVSGAKRLVPVFRQARRTPYIKIPDVPLIPPINPSDFDGKRTKRWRVFDYPFKLPPTPPISGVNVFGQFERLRFQAARGSLTLGPDQPFDLDAATPLALTDIEGPGAVGEHLVIPVRLDSRTAKVRIQGRAKTLINGDPYLTEHPAWVRFVDGDFVTVMAALLGVLLSALALVTGGARARRD
ncbi:MAG: hypothetical protein M3335_08480 [Actinomycetota bacterium]|nr:hypothetical protein [Actinomycetota bacterium]